jgi:Amt family ammonium transporter
VVHSVGGWAALAGIIVLGPRRGKFGPGGKVNAIPGHSMTSAAIGVFVLWFGWFGFNPGSTMAADGPSIAHVATTTNIAAAAATVSSMVAAWLLLGKPDLGMTLNGCLAGLVAITAPCAFVSAWASIVIGLIAGLVVCLGVSLLERWKLDDPVGAVAVHGFNGLWGVLALGIFADGSYGAGLNGVEGTVKGLIYGGTGQFAAQAIGMVTCAVFVLGTAYAFFKLQDKLQGIRVSPQVEVEGLDIHEMGVSAYASSHQTFRSVAAAPEMVLAHAKDGHNEEHGGDQ